MMQGTLPLWRKVVFVDWHGVLSEDPFWSSVVSQRTRLGLGLRNHLSFVFGSESDVADRWMRGEISAEEVVRPARRYLGERRKEDFFERRIVTDCRSMSVDPELASLLGMLSGNALVVLATDNTAEFEDAFRTSPRKRVQRPIQDQRSIPTTFGDVVSKFDDILCSASVGVLKAEDPHRFFGTWLEQRSLQFGDSLLIDDREDNCRAFERVGGCSVQWKSSALGRDRQLHAIREFARPVSEQLPNYR